MRCTSLSSGALAGSILLGAIATGRIDAQECTAGISPAIAQRLYDGLQKATIGADYQFVGVGTEGSKLFIDWRRPGGDDCPRLEVAVVNCGSWREGPRLQVGNRYSFLDRCPGLRSVVDVVTAAAAAEGEIGPPASYPWWLVGLGSLSPGWGVVALVGLILLGLAVRRLWRVMQASLRASPDGGSLARKLAVLAVGSLTILLSIEGTYRFVRWSLRDSQGSQTAGFDLYGVGESTMAGEPFDPKISVPKLLDYAFGHRIGKRPIVVHNLAERGVPLYPQALQFEEATRGRDTSQPGVVLILSGHNERFNADDQARPGWLTVASEWSSVVRDVVVALRRRQILRRETGLAMYEYYLRQVVETARSRGIVPILATMASNLSRIEPNCESPVSSSAQALLDEGNRLMLDRRFAEARALFSAAIPQGSPCLALLEYEVGKCEEALGNYAAARERYWAAVDADPRTMFGRATRSQNDLIRRLAKDYDVPLVDTVALFEARSPNGLLGDDLIMDGQHPTLEGYLILARAYVGILQQRFDAQPGDATLAEENVAAALKFEGNDRARAVVDAGSWLLATSVGHPFPYDRMALAMRRFQDMLEYGDDCGARIGMAIAQAGTAGILRDKESVAVLQKWLGYNQEFEQPAPEILEERLAKLAKFGVSDESLDGVRKACKPRDPPGRG